MQKKLSEIIEALLLSASRPISIDDMVKVFEDPKPTKDEIRNALNVIDDDCSNRGIELKRIASGYRLQVKQTLSGYVAKLWEEKPQRFSKATLETLSLIAYKQPITRGENRRDQRCNGRHSINERSHGKRLGQDSRPKRCSWKTFFILNNQRIS